MRFVSKLLLIVALALAVHPARAGAQDKSSVTSRIIVGHVVTLKWTASTKAGVSYKIYSGGASGGPYSMVGNTSSLQFADLTATAGSTYYYVVTALDSDGESLYSNEVAVVIPVP